METIHMVYPNKPRWHCKWSGRQAQLYFDAILLSFPKFYYDKDIYKNKN